MDFAGALAAFGRALEALALGGGAPVLAAEERVRLLCNRSLCLARMGRWVESLAEADRALGVDPRSEKALYRRATALEELGRPGLAAEALGALLAAHPNNTTAAAALRRVRGGLAQRLREWYALLVAAEGADAEAAFEEGRDLWHALEADCRETGRAGPAAKGGLVRTLSSIATSSLRPEAAATALRSLANLASPDSAAAEQVLSALDVQRVADVLLEGSSATSKVAVPECGGPVALPAEQLLSHSPASAAARLLGCLAAGVVLRSPEEVRTFVASAAAALADGLRADEGLATACVLASVEAGEVKGYLSAFGAAGGWTRVLKLADKLDEVLVRRLFKVWWESASGPDETRAWLKRDALPALTASCAHRESNEGNLLWESHSVRVLNAACAGNLQLGAWCIQQEGVLEGILERLTAPEVDTSQRESVSALLLHVSSSRSGMAIFERAEVTEAFSEALLECADPAVRATLVAVLAKLAANSESPSERLSLFEEVMSQLATQGSASEVGEFGERDLRLLSRQVEALTVLVGDCAVKDRLTELLALGAEAQRGDSSPRARGLHLERLGDKCCRDASLRFGLAHILASVVASVAEREHESLMSSSGEDEEQAERREFQKAFNGQSAGMTSEEVSPEAPAKRKLLFLQGGGAKAACRLSKGASVATQRLVAACMFHVAAEHRCRPLLVQQGALGCLLGIAANGDDACLRLARHALARIFIGVDPKLVPEGLALSAVPLVVDLAGDEYVLQQFEACLALTNLALLGDTVASVIMKRGWDTIQNLLYSSKHERLQVAAAELVANCAYQDRVQEMFRDRNVVRVWLSMTDMPENFGLCRASATALAMLVEIDEMADVLLEEGVVPAFCRLVASDQPDLVWRGLEGLLTLLTPETGGKIQGILTESQRRDLSRTLKLIEGTDAGRFPPQVARLAPEILAHLSKED